MCRAILWPVLFPILRVYICVWQEIAICATDTLPLGLPNNNHMGERYQCLWLPNKRALRPKTRNPILDEPDAANPMGDFKQLPSIEVSYIKTVPCFHCRIALNG